MIAVYDPALGMQEAFELGYTRMNLVEANGIVAIDIGLSMRDWMDGLSAYDYTMSFSYSPSANIVCDSSTEDYQYPCHMTILVQFPSFERTNITIAKPVAQWMVSLY